MNGNSELKENIAVQNIPAKQRADMPAVFFDINGNKMEI